MLQAKKDKWERREKERLRTRNSLAVELEEELMRQGKKEVEEVKAMVERGELGEFEGKEEVEELEARWRRKVEELQSVFAIADPANLKRRVSRTFLSLFTALLSSVNGGEFSRRFRFYRQLTSV